MPGPVLPDAGFASGEAVAMPGLPALTELLHRARRLPDQPDWRSGVMAALFVAGQPPAPVAMAARALAAVPERTGLCFASPLHVVAGISRVHLPPGGRLQLDGGSREAWRTAFNREFGAADTCLHEAGGGWLLQAPFASVAADPDPADLAGQALAREASREPHGRLLRRLGAEVEMWLADHPLNRDALRRQLPPVTCFWFWGGGQAVTLPEPTWRPHLIASPAPVDPWMSGLAAYLDARLLHDAAGWEEQWPESLVLLAPGEASDTGYWREAEARWLAPAHAALRTGSLHGLRLQIGGTAWHVPRRAPWRWLRRRRAWHAMVGS